MCKEGDYILDEKHHDDHNKRKRRNNKYMLVMVVLVIGVGCALGGLEVMMKRNTRVMG